MSTPSIRGFVLAFFLFAFVPSLSISNLVAGQVHEEEVQPVYMSLHSKQTRRNQPKGLMTVEICKNCVDPSSEGEELGTGGWEEGGAERRLTNLNTLGNPHQARTLKGSTRTKAPRTLPSRAK